jgi:hypothetical protein
LRHTDIKHRTGVEIPGEACKRIYNALPAGRHLGVRKALHLVGSLHLEPKLDRDVWCKRFHPSTTSPT